MSDANLKSTIFNLKSTQKGFTPTSPRLPTSLKFRRTSRRVKVVSPAFTIVELLVVIVVIGILAAITLVSYTGITQRATAAALTSDLDNASKQLKLYQALYGSYPILDANKCPTAPVDNNYCLKVSNGNTFTYSPLGDGFGLRAANGTTNYTITNNSSPVVMSTLIVTDSANWLVIGTQVWAKASLNVGTVVTGATPQSDNATLEKYCYNNLESNCTTYGGLYQWNEAMQYVITSGAQGICPAGSHIPTDNDWKILEIQLGMTQAQADTISWRGTNQGTQLKSGGASGLNILLAGSRFTDGFFYNLSSYAYLWSSSEATTGAWPRLLLSGNTTVLRDNYNKSLGHSVRCVGN